jgi:cell division topological specificity factor
MNLFNLFGRRGSAPVARERLQILLAHEKKSGNSDLIVILHREILQAISRHIDVDPDKVEVKMHQRDAVSVLEIDVEIDSDVAKGKLAYKGSVRAA